MDNSLSNKMNLIDNYKKQKTTNKKENASTNTDKSSISLASSKDNTNKSIKELKTLFGKSKENIEYIISLVSKCISDDIYPYVESADYFYDNNYYNNKVDINKDKNAEDINFFEHIFLKCNDLDGASVGILNQKMITAGLLPDPVIYLNYKKYHMIVCTNGEKIYEMTYDEDGNGNKFNNITYDINSDKFDKEFAIILLKGVSILKSILDDWFDAFFLNRDKLDKKIIKSKERYDRSLPPLYKEYSFERMSDIVVCPTCGNEICGEDKDTRLVNQRCPHCGQKIMTSL